MRSDDGVDSTINNSNHGIKRSHTFDEYGNGSASLDRSGYEPSFQHALQPSSDDDMEPPQNWQPWRARTLALYRRSGMNLIGEGTYGSVFIARAPNGDMVALKKVRKERKEGFPITAIREIKILKSVKHPNIVQLRDVVSSHPWHEDIEDRNNKNVWDSSVYMVFEFCDHDLTGLMEAKIKMTDAQVKYYMQCLFRGLTYLHKNRIIHRDIKGANILISNNGDVKIADFGLARPMTAKGVYTNRVVTLWYRAPELLFGDCHYDGKIDMWSAGCLFAELLTGGIVLFPGNNTEADQLERIFALCGSPDENTWHGVTKLAAYNIFTVKPRQRRLRQHFQYKVRNQPQAIELLDCLLQLDPSKRISAEEALQHPYFTSEFPPPMQPSKHPKYTSCHHELASKISRKKGDDAVEMSGMAAVSGSVHHHHVNPPFVGQFAQSQSHYSVPPHLHTQSLPPVPYESPHHSQYHQPHHPDYINTALPPEHERDFKRVQHDVFPSHSYGHPDPVHSSLPHSTDAFVDSGRGRDRDRDRAARLPYHHMPPRDGSRYADPYDHSTLYDVPSAPAPAPVSASAPSRQHGGSRIPPPMHDARPCPPPHASAFSNNLPPPPPPPRSGSRSHITATHPFHSSEGRPVDRDRAYRDDDGNGDGDRRRHRSRDSYDSDRGRVSRVSHPSDPYRR